MASETNGAHSYNRYLAVAARVVRRSLKEEKRLDAEKRGEMDLRFAKWEVCDMDISMKCSPMEHCDSSETDTIDMLALY